MHRHHPARVLLPCLLLACGAAVEAQTCPDNVPHVTGTWDTLPYQMPINPISVTLLRDGRVLVVAGSENDAAHHSNGAAAYRRALWDPTGVDESSLVVEQLYYDVFCSGTAQLPHGRTLIVGGSSDYSFTGERRASIYDPLTGQLVQSQSMADGRWYASATTLGDGRIMAMSGLGSTGSTNTTVEIYNLTNGPGWGSPILNGFTPPLFPRLFLLPDGRVFYTGQGSGGKNATGYYFNPANNGWTVGPVAATNHSYGGCALLPLLPPSYKPRVVCMGGPGVSKSEIIDLSAASPSWVDGPNMSTNRVQMNAVLLPDGRVLASGGSVNDEAPDGPGKTADLYTPPLPDAGGTGSMASGGTASYSRLYHSTALLLPDATVASMGSNPGDRGRYLGAIEIYKPPYLFDSQDRPITTDRPAIVNVSPSHVNYGATFAVTYSSTNPIGSAVLVRPGSTTHAFDMEQRVVGLCGPSPQPACGGGGTLTLTAPPINVAPPGYYMLFLLDTAGVPSIARFIEVSPFTAAAPDGAISSPATDLIVTAGTPAANVTFDTNSVATKHIWVFPGGTPASSTQQHPPAVTYSAPGEYIASLTLVDSNNNSDPSPPTRKIKVLPATANFEIAVDPQSRLIQPGQSTTFSVTITARAGFTGTVTLSAFTEGSLPTGVTVSGFSPPTVTGSGTSTLTMNTTTGAKPYALSLTVKGTSGTTVHAASTTLLVNLAPPQGVAATRGATDVQLSWQASVGASSYMVGRSLVSGGPYETIACPTSLALTDTGLDSATTYYYVVTARYTGGPDAGGASAPSSEVAALSICTPPTYNGVILASKAVGDEVTWSWTTGGASWYDVIRGNLDVLRSTGGDFAAALDAIPMEEDVCIADDMPILALVDEYGAPAADDACEFVILRAVDTGCLAHGTYDEDVSHQPGSRDPGIDASSGDCP